jgi:hypothetical protein
VRIHLGCVLISINPWGCICKVGKTLNFGEGARVTVCIGRGLENGFPSAAEWALRSDVNQYPIESRKLQ